MKYILFLLLIIIPNITSSEEETCECVDFIPERLGKNTWYLLHEIAKSGKSQYDFEMFMISLSNLYPCGECADHIKEYIEENPPQLGPRWMCDFHNSVNMRLDKAIYLCDD